MKRTFVIGISSILIIAAAYLLPGCDELVTETRVIVEAGNPNAEFSVSPDSGCSTLVCSLNDLSSGPRDLAVWYIYEDAQAAPIDSLFAYPDPEISDSTVNADTIYEFTRTHVYSIRLMVSYSATGGSDEELKKRAVIVGSGVSGFTVSDTVGCQGMEVTFDPLPFKFGAVDSMAFSFGDGTPVQRIYTDTIVTHTYNAVGTHSPKLTAWGPCGQKEIIDSNLVRIHRCPDIQFVADVTKGCLPLTVTFRDSTQIDYVDSVGDTVSIGTRVWDFGNGESGVSSVEEVTYNEPGLYTVALELTDTEGGVARDSIIDYITVWDTTNADFTALTPTRECYNPFQQYQVVLEADYPGEYQLVAWQFGDGTSELDSSGVTPARVTHAYTEPGKYAVGLTVVARCGQAVTPPIDNFIILSTPINPDSVMWVVSPDTIGDVLTEFTFTDMTNGIVETWAWDVDGAQSTDSSFSHSYDSPGTKTVSFSVDNSCGDPIVNTFTITVNDTPPNPVAPSPEQ